MVRERRWSTIGVVALFAVFGTGCERGCLSRWFEERGLGGRVPEGSGGAAPRGKTPGLDIGGTDCSDGLLRCVEGRVEASRAAHLPEACGKAGSGERPSSCVCPWDVIGRCASGCASEGVVAIGAPTDAGVAQLCRADAPVARPVLPGDPIPTGICADDAVACVDGVVRACDAPGQPVRALAICLHGCQSHVGLDDVDPGAKKNPDGLVSILCRRGHAERQ